MTLILALTFIGKFSPDSREEVGGVLVEHHARTDEEHRYDDIRVRLGDATISFIRL